ncbi:exonuclease SbcCD subunit SbcC [soil metagenome]
MRPIRLEVRGFTAFRDAQVIDFEGLDLFAIWGPTGSGKSSLLDAMTYALYGQVERIGNRAGLLVSQGQVRLSVLLELALDGARYRIHRSTSQGASGTRVLLEKLSDGEWLSFGEGADRVRDVNGHVERLLGLDYNAFTRSVVLPQGKFAEFLVGDARDRRAILTDLLGLGLFGRMSARSQETAKTAQLTARAKSDVLDSEYAEVGDAQLQQALDSEQTARHRADELSTAATAVEEIHGRFEDLGRRLSALAESLEEVGRLEAAMGARASSLRRLTGAMENAQKLVAAARNAHEAGERAVTESEDAFRAAEGRWGKLEEVSAASVLCQRITEQEAELRRAEDATTVAEQSLAEARVADEEARAALTARRNEADAARGGLVAAEAVHEQAHRSNLVGALTSGLGTGDPCPVCDRPLDAAPSAADDATLQAAVASLRAARDAHEAARQAHAAEERHRALAEQALRQAEGELRRCEREGSRRAQSLAALGEELARHFDGPPPPDPSAAIETRMAELRALAAQCDRSRARLDEERVSLAREEKAAAALDAELSAARSGLGALDLIGVWTRARRAAGALEASLATPPEWPEEPDALAATAEARARELGALGRELQEANKSRLLERDDLLDDAGRALPEWLEIEWASTRQLLAGLWVAAQDAAAQARACAAEVTGMRQRMARKSSLQEEISAALHRAAVHRELAYELRADRLVDFLQAEALASLASFGSDRLAYLSGGRYRFAFERDEFFVVDSWNGEDRRSVRTLSGGETFLASLALALALSEQVQALSVTRRAKLDSLFLDEGFGTLDAETLEIVVSAIEQLGGDGRMVGVITHVPELAERMPTRLVLTKSPRGSAVTRGP